MSFTAHVHIQQRPRRRNNHSGPDQTVQTRLYRLFRPEERNRPAGGGDSDPVDHPPGSVRGADEAARRHRAVQRGDAGAGDQIPGAVEPARSPGQGRQGPDRMYAHGAYLVRILHQGLHLPAVRQRRPAAADRRGETGPRLHPQQSLRPVPGREIGSVRRPVRGSVRHAAPLPERNHALPERHRRL